MNRYMLFSMDSGIIIYYDCKYQLQSKNKKGLENLADEKEADALERQIEAESKRKAEQNDRNRTEFGEEGAEARLRHEGLILIVDPDA